MKLSFNLTKIFADKTSAANIPAANNERVFAADMNSVVQILNTIKSGNIALEVPSATALVLHDGGVYKITGTTQIESIDATGFEEGMIINLFFTGVLTIKQSATVTGNNKKIILAEGSDLITNPNTFISLQYWNSQFIQRMAEGANWNNFTSCISQTPNSTSVIDRTGTIDFTTFLKTGYGIKYKTADVFKYGIITALSSLQITIAGAALTTGSASIQEIYYCYHSNTLKQDIEINNTDWAAASTADILSNGYTAHPLEAPKGALVMAKIWCKTADTGTKSTVNIKRGTNSIFSSALTYTADKTFYNTGVTANTSNYLFNNGDLIVFDVTSPGNKNTASAMVQLYWVLN